MKPISVKIAMVAIILAISSLMNSLIGQDLEFSGVKKIDNQETVKFSIQGITSLETLSEVCEKIGKVKGIEVKSFDFRGTVASVLIQSKRHISVSEIREVLLSLGYDLTSLSVKPNNSSAYKSIRQKEKELIN